MTVTFPSVSIHDDAAAIAQAIHQANAGILFVTDLDQPDFPRVQTMFDHLASPEGRVITDGLNQAYTKNLVYKDSFASGNGGPCVDMKRVLDLSAERLKIIEQANPDLMKLCDSKDMQETLNFWEDLRQTQAPKLLRAVAMAIGSEQEVTADAAFNYRMVDYYHRTHDEPPRCSEHRDFGTFTLIMTTGPGLQVFYQGQWIDVPSNDNGAILLFGWCTQIRSNGRIPAALHRVIDDDDESQIDTGRRTSMVLFCAPKKVETNLEPVVLPGEEAQYIGGIKVGQLRGKMARKWRNREGTLSEEDKILEEEEIRRTNLKMMLCARLLPFDECPIEGELIINLAAICNGLAESDRLCNDHSVNTNHTFKRKCVVHCSLLLQLIRTVLNRWKRT